MIIVGFTGQGYTIIHRFWGVYINLISVDIDSFMLHADVVNTQR